MRSPLPRESSLPFPCVPDRPSKILLQSCSSARAGGDPILVPSLVWAVCFSFFLSFGCLFSFPSFDAQAKGGRRLATHLPSRENPCACVVVVAACRPPIPPLGCMCPSFSLPLILFSLFFFFSFPPVSLVHMCMHMCRSRRPHHKRSRRPYRFPIRRMVKSASTLVLAEQTIHIIPPTPSPPFPRPRAGLARRVNNVVAVCSWLGLAKSHCQQVPSRILNIHQHTST